VLLPLTGERIAAIQAALSGRTAYLPIPLTLSEGAVVLAQVSEDAAILALHTRRMRISFLRSRVSIEVGGDPRNIRRAPNNNEAIAILASITSLIPVDKQPFTSVLDEAGATALDDRSPDAARLFEDNLIIVDTGDLEWILVEMRDDPARIERLGWLSIHVSLDITPDLSADSALQLGAIDDAYPISIVPRVSDG